MRIKEVNQRFYSVLGLRLADYAKAFIGEHADRELGLLQRHLPRGRILDMGCGYGRIAIPLAKLGYDVTGIDHSKILLEEAKRRSSEEDLNIIFKEADISSVPSEDEKFDGVIYMWSVINEIEDYSKSLQESRRLLKTGGKVIVDMPPWDSNRLEKTAKAFKKGEYPQYIKYENTSEFWIDNEHHIIMKSIKPEDLMRQMEVIGFSDIQKYDWECTVPRVMITGRK